jgi:hypothetical protein
VAHFPANRCHASRKVEGISVFGFDPGTFVVKALAPSFFPIPSRPEIAGSAYFGK